MGVPEFRFGSDNRPIEPWPNKLKIVISAILLVLALPACIVADAIARAILPRRIHERYWFPLPRPSDKCPACGRLLAFRLIRVPIPEMLTTVGRPPNYRSIYLGRCSGCDRKFRWALVGKVVVRQHNQSGIDPELDDP